MGKRFINAFVGVLQVNVFADYCNFDAFLRADDALDKFSPVCQVGLGSFKMEKITHESVELLGVQHQGIFVNRMLDIARFNDCFWRNAAEHRQFLPNIAIKRIFGAANQDLRL